MAGISSGLTELGGLTELDIRNAAEAILKAERDGKAMPPLSAQHSGLSLDDAYRVQDLLTRTRQEQGLALAGYKIGLTWLTTQLACDLDAPIHGRILRHAVHRSGASLSARRLVKPHVEVELAFIMGRDIDQPVENPDELLAATDCIIPALELVDHRMAPPRIVADTVADNSAFAGVILAEQRFRPDDIDSRWVGATLSRNGIVEETGLSVIGMGHPAICVAWLANALLKRGEHLAQGDIVMSGAFARALPVASGDAFIADFNQYGRLDVSFT
ncbi:2-keto-4-pentenoate hydratase [Mesorhizobium comanense]|uniref:2-keto-4-pentenoate hydratase n=1 Tax=Mesorhizobium comanense TaxID=2502215 RepID=UPI001E49F8DE|nr:fumarylacetoacetate hydrolase family protein [Mesorhizobium comanense]